MGLNNMLGICLTYVLRVNIQETTHFLTLVSLSLKSRKKISKGRLALKTQEGL